MFKTVPILGAICVELIKTSITYNVVDFYKDTPGNSTPNTCVNIGLFGRWHLLVWNQPVIGATRLPVLISNNSVNLSDEMDVFDRRYISL